MISDLRLTIGADEKVSRLTFREKVDVCWQKQLRDKYLSEGAPPVDLDIKRAVVRRVSRNIAKQIILKYEWLGTLPNCNYFTGIFFDIFCAGVECVCIGGGGGNMGAYKLFNLSGQHELAYLARGANVHWSPPGANSKLVAWTCKLLALQTKCKIAIAYSDTDAGEIGTIYQACNWVYIGLGASTTQWIAPNGRIYDSTQPHNISKTIGIKMRHVTKKMRDSGWKEQRSNPKHRYVYILDKTDKALIDRVERMRQPYPKRGLGETDSAQQTNAETGGASPTSPLLFSDTEIIRNG